MHNYMYVHGTRVNGASDSGKAGPTMTEEPLEQNVPKHSSVAFRLVYVSQFKCYVKYFKKESDRDASVSRSKLMLK